MIGTHPRIPKNTVHKGPSIIQCTLKTQARGSGWGRRQGAELIAAPQNALLDPPARPPAGSPSSRSLCQSAHMQRRRTCCFTLDTLPTMNIFNENNLLDPSSLDSGELCHA